jgi:hypothetical protein
VSVLLPNTWLAVRRQGELVEDSHGDRVPGGWAEPTAHFIGRAPAATGADLQGGNDAARLALDPALWPVKPKDIVVETAADGTPTGQEWTVRTANLLKHSEDDSVDYVRVIGQLRVGASTTP